MGFGGKGANQCVAASKLSALTAMVAKVGFDDYGNSFIKQFQKCNVLTGLSLLSKFLIVILYITYIIVNSHRRIVA